MSLSAKILAFFNVVVAGAFLYFATQAWVTRQPWAYETFRRELMLDGLPLDDSDPGRSLDQAVAADLGDESLGEYFKSAGVADTLKLGGVSAEGIPHYAHTQHEVVDGLVKPEVFKEIDGLADDKAKKERISQLLLLQTTTLEERAALQKQLESADFTVEKGREMLEDLFAAALEDKIHEPTTLEKIKEESLVKSLKKSLKPKDTPESEPPIDYLVDLDKRRQRLAHLLFNLTDDPLKQRRVLVVVGLKSYETAAAQQAANLHKMTQRVEVATLDDRLAFETEYGGVVTQVLDQAYAVAQAQREIVAQKVQIVRQTDAVAKRQQELDELVKKLAAAHEKTESELVKQEKLEKLLFAAQRELGRLREASEKMEVEIRGLELRR